MASVYPETVSVGGGRRAARAQAGGATWGIGLLLAAAAAVRFAGLGGQSFWYDEAATANVVHFGWTHGLLTQIANGESTPPLYYFAVKVWAEVFGNTEVGLRTFSALAGTAAVAVAYLIGVEVAGRRVGLITGALTALNPALIWYSQEARSYELFVLLAGLTVLFCLRARRERRSGADRSRRELVCWSAASALALATHYYAGFVIAAEAAWLFWDARQRRSGIRPLLLACAPLVVVGGALLPLMIHQVHVGHSSWIDRVDLSQRTGQVVVELISFNCGLVNAVLSIKPGGGWALAAMLGVLAGGFGVVRTAAPARAKVVPIAALGAVVIVVPLAVAFVASGGFYDRNLLGAWIPLIVVLAFGFTRLPRPYGAFALAALCGVSLITDIRMSVDQRLERPPWARVAAALTPRSSSRAVLLYPAWQLPALSYYDERLAPLSSPTPVAELDVIANDVDARFLPTAVGPFRAVARRQDGSLAFVRLVAPHAIVVSPALLAATELGRAGGKLLLDPPGARVIGPS
jgi:hypothetical protein